MNITQLQINCTGSMFILAAADKNGVFHVSPFAFGGLVFKLLGCFIKWGVRIVFKILGCFIKWGVRNKAAVKKKGFMSFVLCYMHATLYISFLYSNNINTFYVV